jgi:histidine triad (HIT) family protein
MATIFTKIISGEIPSYKLYENDKVLAILDIFPKQVGHVLIIPKAEIDYWVDLSYELVLEINSVAKKVSAAITKATGCVRVGTMVVGTEVPHYHLHLIPIYGTSFWENTLKKQPSKKEFLELQSKIVREL